MVSQGGLNDIDTSSNKLLKKNTHSNQDNLDNTIQNGSQNGDLSHTADLTDNQGGRRRRRRAGGPQESLDNDNNDMADKSF